MSCSETTSSSSVGTPGVNREGIPSVAPGVSAAAISAASAPETGRSLIVDERFFEEQFLRCQICHEMFDQTDRSPKSLPCNHTFCLPCLTQIFDHSQPPARRTLMWVHETLDGTLKCPTCRVEIFLSKNKIKELPNDHRVVQMMDFLTQAVAKSQNVCSKHDGQPLNFFCKKCLIPVCRDCTVLDHKESDNHKIVDLAEALNENSTQFNEIEIKSRETLEKMKNRSDCLANASKRLDILERHLKDEIKETFIEYRLLLEKRQEALVGMVHQIAKEQKSKINAKFVYVCEHGTQLQKLYDEFKVSRNSNDIRKLFAVNQQMTEHETQFTQIASENDNDLFHSCEFEALNEGSFLSDLSSLGEVRAKVDVELKKPVSAHQLVFLDNEQRRERERLSDSHIMNHVTGDDFLSASDMINMYDGVDVDAVPEEDEPQNYWPAHSAVMSHLLMSYYGRHGADMPESMDDGETITSENRRSRRGRRTRDTNSFQVQSTLSTESPDDLNFFRTPHSTTSDNTSSTPSGYVRSGSRHRTSGAPGANYRVVRHPTASSMRNQTSFVSEDSN